MGSLLQLLSLSRWEVCCSLQTKMQSIVLLLSATLATLTYGAANPGGHHFGHAYHDGPHCHDKKDHQCHKKPKQQEHEECYVDYDIVVDVTYIEECEESLKLLMLITNHMEETITSVQLTLERTMDTPADPIVKTRRRSSATSTPRRTPVRSPSRLARRSLTLSTLRNVRRGSTLSAMKLMREVITAPVWSITTPRLLLLLNMEATRNTMEDIILIRIIFVANCRKSNLL